MTIQVLEGTKAKPYLSLGRRREILEAQSALIWRKDVDNQLQSWSPLRFYYLLTKEYEMPELEARKLLTLMEEKSLSVVLIAAMVQEEIDLTLGHGEFTQQMSRYVSLAILHFILGEGTQELLENLEMTLQ